MDLGTALSIASLAYDVTKDLYDYYRTWKDCEKDVAVLREQLLWLHHAFEVSRDVVRKPGLSAQAVDLLYSALAACNDAANELRDVLEKIRKRETPQTAWNKLKVQGRKSCYPFRKPTVTAIKANVDACCDELHLAVDLLHLDTASRMHKVLEEVDAKLVDGFEAIDTALKQLPVIASTVSAIRNQTGSVKADTAVIMDTLRTEKEREAMEAILGWLCATDYSRQQNDFYARRQDGTGAWFLESREYLAWFRGTTRTLVCPGQPGAGKTIMAATVIHHLLQTVDIASVGIIYLFCNYKQRNEQVATHLLGALVRQLLHHKTHVPASIMDMYDYHKSRKTRPSQEELAEALLSLIHRFTTVYIVIDALDECETVARRRILSTLGERHFHSTVRLLVTTRPLPDILEEIVIGPKLEVRASNFDVSIYLRARISELPKCARQNQDLQKEIVAVIVLAVDGIFLLARLHMDSLKDKRTIKSVRLALERLPQGSAADVYEKAYSDAMERICGQPQGDTDLAKEALSWIARAQRPLQAIELQNALAVEVNAEVSRLDEDNLLPVDEIVSLCAGLIIEDKKSGTIRLVHYTTQNFFEHNWMKWIPDAETIIALKCVKYLSFESFLVGPCRCDEELEDRLAQHPLLEYSAEHWGTHLSAAKRHIGEHLYASLQDSALCLLQNSDLVLSATQAMALPMYRFQGYARNYTENTQGPHLAGRFGVEKLMKALLQADCDVNCLDNDERTPLSYAAERGHEAVVKLLLDTGQVEIDLKDEYGQTPLSRAAAGGHEAVVKLLLDTGQVEIDSKDTYGQTPLSCAAEGGHEAVVKLLLDTGQVEIDLKDNEYGQTPLSWAAEGGHEAVVKLLLDTGQVEIDSKDTYGQTPLSWAAEGGHEAVVKLLLDTSQVEIDSKDTYGQTPLSCAAEGGHEAVVKLLLDTGQVEIDLKDEYGQTPLSWAAARGHEAVVKLLLDTGQVEIDSKDTYGQTPLSRAVEGGHEAVVKLLLDTGQVEIDSKDNEYGQTLLSRAAKTGHKAVVKLLEAAVKLRSVGAGG